VRGRRWIGPALAYLVLATAVGWLFHVEHAQRGVRHREQSRINHRFGLNLAVNVERTCTGINATRDYDRLFVRKVSAGHVLYTLPDSDCVGAVEEALNAPARYPVITQMSNPVLWYVLHRSAMSGRLTP
jgi:hypothetical protein